MNVVKLLGLFLTLGGMAALIFAVVELLDGEGFGSRPAWIAGVLGVIFFFGGLRLLTSPGAR